MNTKFLETLVWLTRLRSFSRTAEALNATQPAISNRINKLEELLNVRLYDRASREFDLTPAGRRILRHAEQIVKLTAELHEFVLSDELIDRQIRIGVVEVVTISWLPVFTSTLSATFPKVSFHISTGTTLNLIEKLRSDELDLIFIIGVVNEPRILSRPICNMNMSWLARTDMFDIQEEIDVIELSRLPIVLSAPGSSIYDVIIEYFRLNGILDVPSRDGRLILDCVYSIGTAMHMVRCGLGIMALPTFLFSDDLREGRVRSLSVRQKLQPAQITACVKRPSTNLLLDRLVSIAGDSAKLYIGDAHTAEMWI